MGFEQLERRGGAHLAGDDAFEVLLDGQLVDGAYLVGFDHQPQCAAEGLRLVALPVETDTDDDILERKRGVAAFGGEEQFAILVAIPENAALGKCHHLGASDVDALGGIGFVQREAYLLCADDAHGDVWLSRVGNRLAALFFHPSSLGLM